MATSSTAAIGGMPPKVTDPATTITSKSAAASSKIAKDMNTFLTLLTTQLKYQDPLSPMDSSKFTDQLVQFANVEQHIQTNSNLESLINLQTGGQAAAAINYIGTTVEAYSDQLPLVGGTAEFSYALPQETTKANIVIRDASGLVVRTIEAKHDTGKHTVTWDGKDNFKFPKDDGVYSITVTGTTAEGDEVSGTTGIIGKVTGVETTREGKVVLSIGGAAVTMDDIIGVKAATTTTATTAAATN